MYLPFVEFFFFLYAIIVLVVYLITFFFASSYWKQLLLRATSSIICLLHLPIIRYITGMSQWEMERFYPKLLGVLWIVIALGVAVLALWAVVEYPKREKRYKKRKMKIAQEKIYGK